jgi:hypothetical protein
MAVDINLLRAYTDGAVYTHDVGATITAPTDATTALDVDFKEIGAITDDGITESFSQDRTDVFIWQGATLARRLPGQTSLTFQFAAAELKLLTLQVQYPGSTVASTTEGASVAVKAPTTDIRAWVLHGKDGASRAQRVYIPLGEVTERGDQVWTSGGVTFYEWTLSAYPDSNGVFAYKFFIDPAMATP